MKIAALFLLVGLVSTAAAHAAPHPVPGFGFEENKAQWPAAARYRALVPGGAVWLRATGFTYDWVSTADLRRFDAAQAAARPQAGIGTDLPAPPPPMRLHGHAVTVDFVGAAPARPLQAAHPLESYTNYFIGTDSSKWASRVRTYADVIYPQLYPGVDVRVHGSSSGQFEYDVVVAPGANPALVQLRYRGAAKLRLRADGALAITTSVGEVREQRPVAWQVGADGQRQVVPCQFRLAGEVLSFVMPAGYDQQRELVIDPVILASTYTGLVATAIGTAYDAAGNICLGANVNVGGSVFPVTPGAYTVPTGSEIGISKFNAANTRLLFTTVLGGAGPRNAQGDFLRELEVDAADNIYFVAESHRNSFPMLPTSYDATPNTDKVILGKLSPTGTALLGATYLGGSGSNGSGRQEVTELTFEANGSVYVAGSTNRPNFPTTAGAYITRFTATGLNSATGFISHFDANLTTLLWSTFITAPTSSVFTEVFAIRVNAAGLVYFSASTGQTYFPVPATAASTVYAGDFIGCLSATGSNLVSATYLPGVARPGDPLNLRICRLDFDNSGNIALLGTTVQGSVQATPGAVTHPWLSPAYYQQVFVAKLSANLTTVLQLGIVATGVSFLTRYAQGSLRVDACGNILFILGIENGFPEVSVPPIVTSIAGGTTQAVATGYYLGVLNANASQLLFGTYFGSGGAVYYSNHPGAIDRQGRFFLLYGANDPLLPTYTVLPGAYHTAPLRAGSYELITAILDPQLTTSIPRASLTQSGPVCLGQAIVFSSTSTATNRIRWDFGDGSPNDSVNTVLMHTYTRPGTYRVRLLARPVPGSCAPPDTTSTLVRIGTPAVRALLPRVYLCPGQSATLDAGNPGSTYAWNTGATTQTISVAQPGTYVVAIRTPCGRVDTARVLVPAPPRLVRDSVACAGGVTLRVADPDPAATYLWSTGATTSALAVTEPGRYTLAVAVGGCRFELAAVAAPAGAVPTVPNVFTPGPADDLNATFKVPGLPPGSRLRVYSRWGHLVYEAADYRNTWDAAGLSAGSYYYLLENPRFCQGSAYKGWVEVIR